mmetsp:Transcript_26698/g.60343  ORF Transcript_26698/g.60343 Transcript_26698/m.60343 type:complete len:217 (+) Transcript_26698:339-989(+)
MIHRLGGLLQRTTKTFGWDPLGCTSAQKMWQSQSKTTDPAKKGGAREHKLPKMATEKAGEKEKLAAEGISRHRRRRREPSKKRGSRRRRRSKSGSSSRARRRTRRGRGRASRKGEEERSRCGRWWSRSRYSRRHHLRPCSLRLQRSPRRKRRRSLLSLLKRKMHPRSPALGPRWWMARRTGLTSTMIGAGVGASFLLSRKEGAGRGGNARVGGEYL